MLLVFHDFALFFNIVNFMTINSTPDKSNCYLPCKSIYTICSATVFIILVDELHFALFLLIEPMYCADSFELTI